MEDNVAKKYVDVRGQTFTSSLGRQSCFPSRDGSFHAARKPQGQAAPRARRKRLETFELLRTYRVYVFLWSFREAHRGCMSVWAHVRYARVEERVPLGGFPPIVARHPTLSSRTIVKPPLSGHINTSTSVLSSTREVDMSPNPPSPRRTLVILNNRGTVINPSLLSTDPVCRFELLRYLSVFSSHFWMVIM